MKTAIICGTSFQVFNALNLIYNDSLDNELFDIYIFDRFIDAKHLAHDLDKFQKIVNVYLIKDYQKDTFKEYQLKGAIKTIHSAYKYLFPKASLKFFFTDYKQWEYATQDNQYKRILAPTPSFFLQCLEKINDCAILDYYEDGLGSYSGNFDSDYASKGRKIFSKIFRVGYNVIPVRNLYVYEPTLCNSTVAHNIIGMIKPTPEFINAITDVFNLCTTRFKGNEIVWLGQRRVDDTVIAILKELKSLSSKRNVVIRKHPKDMCDEIYRESGISIDYGDNMWEIMLANSEMTNVVLISSYSTALFTPKILFDQEPTIILVYKLFPDINPIHRRKAEYFVPLLQRLYNNKEKVKIPTSFEELKKILYHT